MSIEDEVAGNLGDILEGNTDSTTPSDSDNKCFCHLTIGGESYVVKDAKAREQISELSNKINGVNNILNIPIKSVGTTSHSVTYEKTVKHSLNQKLIFELPSATLPAFKSVITIDIERLHNNVTIVRKENFEGIPVNILVTVTCNGDNDTVKVIIDDSETKSGIQPSVYIKLLGA